MLLTANDRERRVEVSAGTVVTVRLPEEATTGYRWTIEAGEGLEQAGDRVEPPGAIGGEEHARATVSRHPPLARATSG